MIRYTPLLLCLLTACSSQKTLDVKEMRTEAPAPEKDMEYEEVAVPAPSKKRTEVNAKAVIDAEDEDPKPIVEEIDDQDEYTDHGVNPFVKTAGRGASNF